MVVDAHFVKPDPAGPLEAKRRSAIEFLRSRGRVVVALSGGVDSAVLLVLAVDAVGAANVLAVTGVSDAVIAEDVEDARSVAGLLGVTHEIVATREMERPGYRANSGDRCFHCRSELFELLRDLADRRGFGAIVYGVIVDDLGEERPGMEAARSLGVLSPLTEGGEHRQRRCSRLGENRRITNQRETREPMPRVAHPRRRGRDARAPGGRLEGGVRPSRPRFPGRAGAASWRGGPRRARGGRDAETFRRVAA